MIAAPFLIVLFVLSLPVVLPIVGLQQARGERRKRACVEHWPCGWCVAPLGAEALTRADALSGGYADAAFDDLTFVRLVHDLHACCPRCNAGHRYDEAADRFVLLYAHEFAAMYGDLLDRAVAPATATLAWPWLPPRTASHTIALTRDSACMGDDVDARHEGSVAVPADLAVPAIAEALLRSPWLPHVGGTATWSGVAGPATFVFGVRSGMPFVHATPHGQVQADTVASLHVRYHAQRDPATIRAGVTGG